MAHDMSDTTIKVSVGEQPVNVKYDTDEIKVNIVSETIHAGGTADSVKLTIKEEKLGLSSPLVLAAPGWPFGSNPVRVDGLANGVQTVIDRIVMPGYYIVARWLLLLTDDANQLAVSSEISCMRRGNVIHFIEYATLGDTGVIAYDLDVVAQGEQVYLTVTSKYPGGILTARSSKIGIFN